MTQQSRQDLLHWSEHSQISGAFSQLEFFTVGISSTDLGALSFGEVFSQFGIFHSWDFLHQSQSSQIGFSSFRSEEPLVFTISQFSHLSSLQLVKTESGVCSRLAEIWSVLRSQSFTDPDGQLMAQSRSGFAGPEFLASGTDMDLKRAQSRLV